MAPARAKPGKSKGYRMPEKLPIGEVLTDRAKSSWILKQSIGVGGFGEIYCAVRSGESSKKQYAVKIEPLENGPLFCERAVYLNIGKQEQIKEFASLKKIKYLGMPAFYGFGSHVYKSIEHRFIVVDKLGKDLWSLFLSSKKRFPLTTILKISIQIIYVLEYMHGKGYVHCDIKGPNLLLGEGKEKENQVYLVDFGLACKYPQEYKPNPKKAHNGTLEYTSRDLHNGVPSRRGDLEILAFNILQWVGSELPWEKLTNPKDVFLKKEEAMKNPKNLISKCFGSMPISDAVSKYVLEIAHLDKTEDPNYDKLRNLLQVELKKVGSDPKILEFTSAEKYSPIKKTPVKGARANVKETASSSERDEEEKTAKLQRLKSPVAAISDEGFRRSPRNAEGGAVKRSWRDFPTIVNGAVKKGSPQKKVKR